MIYTSHEILTIAKTYKAILLCFLGLFLPPLWIITIPLLVSYNYKLKLALKDDTPLILFFLLHPITGGVCFTRAREVIEEHGFKVGITGPNISEIEDGLRHK